MLIKLGLDSEITQWINAMNNEEMPEFLPFAFSQLCRAVGVFLSTAQNHWFTFTHFILKILNR